MFKVRLLELRSSLVQTAVFWQKEIKREREREGGRERERDGQREGGRERDLLPVGRVAPPLSVRVLLRLCMNV